MPTAEELVRVEPLDPFHELSSVLWFLASLTSDHEPGCIVKDGKGEPCDCDVVLREGEPWWKRVRASLRLPSALKGRLLEAEEKLTKRRVVQVRPTKGEPGPKGFGTVYEVELKSSIAHIAVVHYERGTVTPEQLHAFQKVFADKFDTVLALCVPQGWELTVLELP
jgi:hypothetical protein